MGGPFEELDYRISILFLSDMDQPHTLDKLWWAYENMGQKSLRCDLLTCGEHLQFIPSFYYWNLLSQEFLGGIHYFLPKTNKTGRLIDHIIGFKLTRLQLFFFFFFLENLIKLLHKKSSLLFLPILTKSFFYGQNYQRVPNSI